MTQKKIAEMVLDELTLPVPMEHTLANGGVPNDYMFALHYIKEQVPEESYDTVSIFIDTSYGSRKAIVTYMRPITPEEVADIEKQLEALSGREEAKERAEYERLKAKYGQGEYV